MGDVVDLLPRLRQRRGMANHPAGRDLRWKTKSGTVSHRLIGKGLTECGLNSPLVIASPVMRRCRTCR